MNQQKVWDTIAVPWKKYRFKKIKEVQDFLKGTSGNILDLGCGSGRNFAKIKGTIYAIDFSKNMLKYAKEYAKKENIKVKLIYSQIDKIPIKDNFFNAAVFIAVLHCIETKIKRKKALKELLRVLEPGAKAMITVWNKNQKRFEKSPKEKIIDWKSNNKNYPRYYYLYEKDELKKLLKEVGFKINKIHKKNENGQYSKNNLVFVVEKPISS